jgi:F-type H+-transporting ATPase subunit b
MHRLLKMAIAVGIFWAVAASGALALEAAQEHKEATPKAPVGQAVEKPGEKGHAAPSAASGHEPEKAGVTEHGGGGPSNPLKPEPTLAIWTLVVFIGLFAILSKFAWKPLMHALHEREKHLEHVLHETERARNESEGLLSEHRKQMARAAEEVRGLLEQARADAQRTGEKIVKQAQDEAESAKQRAQRDIGAARDSALAEIWEKTADMAVSVAGRVLSKELTEGDHKRLLDAAIGELPAAPGSNGHGGKA